MGYTNIVTFVNNGVFGVTMDRPGFNKTMRQLEEGRASALFVKDLSQLDRNYIEVGRLMEEFFLEHDIRLVDVSDNIDTAEGENGLAPIRNLFNEWYPRDISKKRRISDKIKGNAGNPWDYLLTGTSRTRITQSIGSSRRKRLVPSGVFSV